MNSFFVFFGKEWTELTRTKKFYIFLGIFALFGMVSPILARYMQEIFVATMGDKMPSIFPASTWIDSYSQLYSNLVQMGGISLIFLFMGCVVSEKQNGSAALTLTKNLSIAKFIMAKFAVASILILLSTIVAILLCWAYTYYLFGFAGDFFGVFMGGLAYYFFALTLLSITVLFSTIAKSTAVSALLSFSGFLLLTNSNYLPQIGAYLPGALISNALELTQGAFDIDIFVPITVSFCIVCICLLLSVQILKRQEF